MREEKPVRDSVSVPVRLPKELDELITATAKEVKLSKQDTMRLGLERGMSILKQQLAMPVVPTATAA